MKTYFQKLNDKTYQFFYDRSIHSWTVIEVDSKDYQIGEAHYFNPDSDNARRANLYAFEWSYVDEDLNVA